MNLKEKRDLFGNEINEYKNLRQKFIEPPFSVLDTKSGSWQARKKRWRGLGIDGHLGRKQELCLAQGLNKIDPRKSYTGTSIFDPVLCELLYNWFCPDGGSILDPFAGGSVRGIVANYLGYKYTGVDIRQEQIDSNRDQALDILPVNNQPSWYVGDSNNVLDGDWINKFDFILSCPPYADLEKYSDLPGDISNMDYPYFVNIYESIIIKACKLLKPGRFACFVVGEVRDKNGSYVGFVPDTYSAFKKAGMQYYNEAILLENGLNTAAMRADKQFNAGKKLVKTHQNILIFKKQD